MINEKQKLISLIDEEVWDLLKANNAIIAGGAITSLFTNKEVKDIDVYLPSQRAVVNILAEAFNKGDYTETNDYLTKFQLRFINLSDKSMMFKNKEQEVQLITFKYFNSAQEIFDTFDFTCCMGAFDFAKDEFIFHPDFFKHNSQRYLKFNPGTAFPLMSALRVNKYIDKGYEISKSEFLRVILKCMTLNISSWDEAKNHLGGMYGYNMNEFFDETVDFNLDTLISQLDSRSYKKRTEYQDLSLLEFNEILEKFDSAEEIDDSISSYREGYYYKTVTKDFKSPYVGYSSLVGKPMSYEIGSIVNGGEKYGIFIHRDPLYPWQCFRSQDRMIELEPVGEFKYQESTDWDKKKAQLFGDFKVVREVPYVWGDMSKSEIKYLVRERK